MKKSIATLFCVLLLSISIFADGVIDSPGKTSPPPANPPSAVQSENNQTLVQAPVKKAVTETDFYSFWLFLDNFLKL